MNKIICLYQTSVGFALKSTYSRCELGRTYVDNYILTHFSFRTV